MLVRVVSGQNGHICYPIIKIILRDQLNNNCLKFIKSIQSTLSLEPFEFGKLLQNTFLVDSGDNSDICYENENENEKGKTIER